jgi:hypothetical protein
MTVKNNLAYYDTELIMVVKSFKIQALGKPDLRQGMTYLLGHV